MTQNTQTAEPVDVLCVGHASYDLIFSIPHHPASDEKLFAQDFCAFGGGPAANAAVLVARLGLKAAFAGYLGDDLYGDRHLAELQAEGVQTRWVVRGPAPTPLSAILVKPDGSRSLINYKGQTEPLPSEALVFDDLNARTILFDGHEPAISVALALRARALGIPTVLDAGSLHAGTQALMGRVDYLVASEKFAAQFSGAADPQAALWRLSEIAPAVVITLGERGLIWHQNGRSGALAAYPIHATDTTGAGDAFHGAFAAALCEGMGWREILLTASAAGALCCTHTGARPGMPTAIEVANFLERFAAPPENAVQGRSS
ncbi:carbohydrate kinase family protein [Methyloterricola oryzae]|uniref:carbohydrate kinase family protein n=1 Tax=Methyloterricola oryzae TaxID=1495050 RepID=UPI0005EB1ECA|nr:PfkB family carbohydrate kinase [Methyloterricola oryzae]